MQKIVCAFFFHDTDYYSGATRSLLDLIENYIVSSNIEVIAVFPKKMGSAIDYLKNKGVNVICSRYWWLACGINERKCRRIVHFPKRLLELPVAKLWIRFKTVPLLKKYGVNIIYNNTSVILSGYWAANVMKVPVIAHFREFGEEDHKITIWFGRRKFYNMAANFDKIICISKSLENKYRSIMPNSSFQLLYDDLSPQYINWSYDDKKTGDVFNILLVGSIAPGKGQLIVIKKLTNLLRKNNNIKLFLAGQAYDKTYMGEIKNYIEVNHLQEKVQLLGLVKDMNSLRKDMHIGIVMSDMEAFGRVTIEGMLSGMIMIATNTGGSAELITDGVTGYLVDKNGDGLSATVQEIILNWDKQNNIRQCAFEYAKGFTVGRCADGVAEVLRSVMS